MTARVLDGRKLAEKIRKQLAEKIAQAKKISGLTPGLAYLLVDNDPISKIYVAGKTRACKEVGIFSITETFPSTIQEQELLQKIELLNDQENIHGIIVQLPLPPHLKTDRIMEKINPGKDVDSFHPFNRGLLFASHAPFTPCTPKGIILLLKENGIPLEGKHVVILGRSLVVGRPLAMMLLNENATVTICHQKTQNLEKITQSADILVAAIGKPEFVGKNHIKPGTVVVDVGISRIGGKLVGDVKHDEVAEIASAISPVPGGVGPMTVAMLLENAFLAFQNSSKINISHAEF